MISPRSQRPGAAPDLRISEIDILRGIALIGIYWINIVIFALPHGAYSLPHLLGDHENLNIATWAFSEVFVEGTMRGLFSMLFGASTLIFLSEAKLESSNGLRVVDNYYRRCITLMMFGLFHAYILLAQWDLLFMYGLLGMFLFPLRKLGGRTLIVIGLTLFIISDFNVWRENYVALQGNEQIRSLPPSETAPYFTQMRETNTDEMQVDIDTYRSGYWAIFNEQIAVVAEQQSSKLYSDHFFDMGGMMLFGMALYKFGVLTLKRSLTFYLVLFASGWLFGGVFRGIEAHELWLVDFNSDARDPNFLMPYNFDRIIMTLGHVGLFGVVMKLGLLNWCSGALSAMGRLALTNYVGQSILSAFIFYGFGLGYFAYFERYELTWVFLGVIAVQLAFSVWWLSHFRMGPLEWLWRSMIYGAWQPLVREPTGVPLRS